MELGTQKAAAKESAALLTGGPQPLPPLQRAWDSGALSLPGLQGSPHPHRPREAPSLPVRATSTHTPLTGRSPNTGCQPSKALAHPDPDYRRVDDTPGATELGFPPSDRNNSQQPGSGATRPKAAVGVPAPAIPGRAQTQPHISQPRASERPGPHSRPTTGAPSQRSSPSTHGGHAQPCLQDGTPTSHPLQEAPRSTRLPPTPELQAGLPGSSRTSPTSCLWEPAEQPRPTQRGGHRTRKQNLNLRPLTGQGGVVPIGWMARAAGCSAAASPHLVTGWARGLLGGLKAPQLETHAPNTGLSRHQRNRRPRKDRPKP